MRGAGAGAGATVADSFFTAFIDSDGIFLASEDRLRTGNDTLVAWSPLASVDEVREGSGGGFKGALIALFAFSASESVDDVRLERPGRPFSRTGSGGSSASIHPGATSTRLLLSTVLVVEIVL